MKISVPDFEMRLIPFLKKVADSMPTSLHKWLGGAMIASSAKRIEEMIASQADGDGVVDTEKIRALVCSGFDSSGDEVVIPFGSESLSAFGIRPVNVKISRADADQFFAQFV